MKPILFLTILCISLFHAKNTYSTGVQALDNAPGIRDALSVKDRAVFKANCLLNCRSSKCTDPYRATACAQLCNKCSDVLPTRALEAINGFDLNKPRQRGERLKLCKTFCTGDNCSKEPKLAIACRDKCGKTEKNLTNYLNEIPGCLKSIPK